MAPMSSMNDFLSTEDRATLLTVARQSIQTGLRSRRALGVDPEHYPDTLHPVRATFVTLEIETRLRGCIGTLEARQALVIDVAEHAYAAAFEDPRFPPLHAEEFAALDIHISVLSPPEPVAFDSEEDLLAKLRPGVDGIILSLGDRRATFLPSVWEDLSEPHAFLGHLKRKAGLKVDFWADDIKIQRYMTESF